MEQLKVKLDLNSAGLDLKQFEAFQHRSPSIAGFLHDFRYPHFRATQELWWSKNKD
jgi:hypothetical protein